MAMPTVNDEILDPSLQPDSNPRYTIRDNSGKIISDNVQIEMKTPVVQNGTALNKAFFTKLYNTIMTDTSELVVNYTSTQDMQLINITNLNLEQQSDGIYDVVAKGSAKNETSTYTTNIALQINGITSESYIGSDEKETFIPLGIKKTFGGICKFSIVKHGSKIFVSGTTTNQLDDSNVDLTLIGGAIEASNVTSIQFISYIAGSTSTKHSITSGFNVKIYKRR